MGWEARLAMDDLLSPAHLIFLALVALFVFGPSRLPAIGSGVGRAVRDFRQALRGEEGGDATAGAPAATPLPASRAEGGGEGGA